MDETPEQLTRHLDDLQAFLRREQPLLAGLVDEYRNLDRAAYRLGLLPRNESYANQVSWWPLISILGTFSAGKSTFINDYLGADLQRAAHHAVDDKFTVICYAADGAPQTLPGTAMDADPRFPFYAISREIETVAAGEGRRLDSYLQLKTCPSEKLKGRILIDSPGFDADDQRTATLQIADRIIDRSDLVLVFFDAHRPEPGAIRDTLEHLVAKAARRHDATKFVYILNQIDVTADENSLEDVVAAWQRALAQKGLTAGRFYRVFSRSAAAPIKDQQAAQRLGAWRDQDMAALETRFGQVKVERVYRVAHALRRMCSDIESAIVPDLRRRLRSWRRFVLIGDAVVVVAGLVAAAAWLLSGVYWAGGLSYAPPPTLQAIMQSEALTWASVAALVGAVIAAHVGFRAIARRLYRPKPDEPAAPAYMKSTRALRSVLLTAPAGWHFITRRELSAVFIKAGEFIKQLNDRHIDPDGIAATAAFADAPVDSMMSPDSPVDSAMDAPAPSEPSIPADPSPATAAPTPPATIILGHDDETPPPTPTDSTAPKEMAGATVETDAADTPTETDAGTKPPAK